MNATPLTAAARRAPKARDQRGFTLIELLVVLVILGLLAGLAGPRVIKYLSGAKSDTAKVQIEQLAAGMDLFILDVGRYPADDEGLQALVEAPSGVNRWNGPYLTKKEVPLDPWGNPYTYRLGDGGKDFEIYTLGADNAEGGEGENADVRHN
ncbi:MAG: type II secretion system major pseudopilin GspG [Rhodobacterales bacterium]|nr:type II secretion system major pseudopilin GspG [Rhodobacterales bacterium]